jgi:glutamate-5-semialdehyde dehydrogenase
MSSKFYMKKVGENAKSASISLANLNLKKRNEVLRKFCIYLKAYSKSILKENSKDILNAKSVKASMIGRLQLDDHKINQIIRSTKEIIKFKDPLGKILSKWKRPNGLKIKKLSIPLGVIGVIYESRPNVTADVAALCFKAGSAVILKGGSEAFHSNKILSNLFRKAIKATNCNENCVQFIQNNSRKNVDYLLSKMQNYVDVIIPRGGKNLVKKVKAKSKVPIIGHLEGICHVYIHKKANLKMAIKIVKNAKMRNVGICGAAETLLIDKTCLKTHCLPILNELVKSGCKIIAENKIKKIFSKKIKIASLKDWDTEYLSSTISVKSVKGIEDAINHINKHGTSHTDAIVTGDKKAATKFFLNTNSSIVIHNSSTQFADGGEFGFGAEIGISTEKLPPRGPVGIEQLTTYKYIVEGKGQIRK